MTNLIIKFWHILGKTCVMLMVVGFVALIGTVIVAALIHFPIITATVLVVLIAFIYLETTE